MSAVVADTHSLLWFITNDARLSKQAGDAMDEAEATDSPIFVPSIVIVEMRYLVDKRRIDEAHYQLALKTVRDPLTAPTVAPLDLATADSLEQIKRADVPDMPDRIIAATALHLGYPLVSRDGKIRASGILVIW